MIWFSIPSIKVLFPDPVAPITMIVFVCGFDTFGQSKRETRPHTIYLELHFIEAIISYRKA